MAAGDLFWDAVGVAMHMDSVGLTDVKGNAMTLNGGVTRSATQSKFGGYSAHFDGVDDELFTTGTVPALEMNEHGMQFFCYPETQLMANPCVLATQEYLIEYKPAGHPYGFVLDYNGLKVELGVHPEGAWYFIWIVRDVSTLTIHVDGAFIASIASIPNVSNSQILIGSRFLGTHADSAFKGYVEDLLATGVPIDPILTTQGHLTRWDTTVPTVAFLERLPDPEGTGLGSIAFTGEAVGIVAPIGGASGSMRFTGLAEGTVPCAGQAAGSLRFSGLGVGVVGRTGVASGSLRFTGSATGFLGVFGVASGSLKFKGSAVGAHGVSGVGSGSLRLTGAAVGTTPEHPVGEVRGSLRFTGNARGQVGLVDTDTCH